LSNNTRPPLESSNDRESHSNNLTYYERSQAFNPLVSFLHGTRYKHLLNVFDALSSEDSLRVVDIGCAHAKVFQLLNSRFKITYVGIELDKNFAAVAEQRYGTFKDFKIINGLVQDFYSELENADVVLALETLEHIPEHIVVRVIEGIVQANPKVFMCSVPNEVGPIISIKNVGSLLMGYTRHKEYKWSETFFAGIFNLDKVETHGTTHKGFDWRWLAQTIRHNMKITKIHSTPISWLPKTLSASIIFVCVLK
jgi:SAM-dependent methyltransferase